MSPTRPIPCGLGRDGEAPFMVTRLCVYPPLIGSPPGFYLPMTSWIHRLLRAVDLCRACDQRRWCVRSRRNVFGLSHGRMRIRCTIGMSDMSQSVSMARCVLVAGRLRAHSGWRPVIWQYGDR